MERILITGANGLIGKSLTDLLVKEGYEVMHLVRKPDLKSAVRQHSWNPSENLLDPEVFSGVDHVIHLAGSNIGEGRWTKNRRNEMRKSRIDSANLLFEKSKNSSLKSFVSASGISIYGTVTSEEIYTENAEAASDFLGQLTVDWEKSADQFLQRNVRVVKIRTGVVLSKNGGALHKMTKPFRFGFGAALGKGNQYFPWIHLDDLCHIYLSAIRNTSFQGAYNAVAPQHITNRELTQKISKQIGKRIWLPAVPSFLLQLLFGEMAGLILKGSRVSCQKILDTPFSFKYPQIEEALKDCL
jgi:uncharacterized protein